MRLQLTGPSYDVDITSFEKQKCINWFLQGASEAGATQKYGAILRPTWGIEQLFDFGDFSSGRGSVVYRDIAYVILDDTFCLLEEDGTPSYIDLLETTEGPVSMCGAMNGIIMADGTKAYFYDTVTNVFTTITDADLPSNPICATYYKGYNILLFANSEKYYYSVDPLAWDALDFNSANVQADYLIWAVADHDELWLFGTATTEVHYATGDATLPLAQRPGVLITKGCRAPNTITATDNAFFWLGTDPAGGVQVYTTNGYNAIQLPASGGILAQISKYTTLDDAYGFVHRIDGHPFYVLTFPTEQVTWVYDLLTQFWHQRASITTLNPFSADYEPALKAHRAKNYCYAYGQHFVLDQYTGSVARYNKDIYTDFDMPIWRIRRSGQLTADVTRTKNVHIYDNKLATYHNLILNMEPGVGLSSGQGSDPQVFLRTSTDGGFTWDDCGSRSMGAIGVYGNEIKWEILGQSRQMVFEISVTDPVKAVLLDCTVDMILDKQ